MNGPYRIEIGSTSVTRVIRLYDATTGAPITGVTVTDLDYWYIRTETDNDVTLSSKGDVTDLTSLTAAFSGGGMYEVGYGWYRFDIPDAANVAGAIQSVIVIEDAASSTIRSESIEIDLLPVPADVIAMDDDVIAAAKIATGAFTADAFAADALVAATFATGAFTADAFAADAIVAATLATGALTADAFAADALVAATFATGCFTADAFAANALVAATFAADCITAAKIAAGAIDNATFAADVGSTAYATNIIALAVSKAVTSLATTLSAGNTTPSFTLTAGVAAADAYNGMIIVVEDADDNTYEARRITDYTSGRVVTVDTAFSFTPATNDKAYIMNQYDTSDNGSPGAYNCTITLKDTTGTDAISGATVWVSLLADGSTAFLPGKVTNSSGVVTLWLPANTYYVFASGGGYSYSNDGNFVVSGTAASNSFNYGTQVEGAPGAVGSVSGSSFIARGVNRVRKLTDEPVTNAKYDNSAMIEFLEEAYAEVLQDVQRSSTANIKSKYTFTYDEDVTDYVLPATVGRVLSIGEEDDNGYKIFYESGSQQARQGTGCTVAGNIVKFQTTRYLTDGQEVVVYYLPTGCARLMVGATAADGFTTTTVTYDNITLGTRDTRPGAYVGSVLRVLTDANNTIAQDRIITGVSANTLTYTVSPAFNPVLSAGNAASFEICPPFGEAFDLVVATKAALTITGIEGNETRQKTLSVDYSNKMRTLQLAATQKDAMGGPMQRSNTVRSTRGSRGYHKKLY